MVTPMLRHALRFVALLVASSALVITVAHGKKTIPKQPIGKSVSKQAIGKVVRYLGLPDDAMGDGSLLDGYLRVVVEDGKFVSAELDVCSSLERSGGRDRFVVPLKLEGQLLEGTTVSQENKVPIKVSLTPTQTENTFSMSGFVTLGGIHTPISFPVDEGKDERVFKDEQMSRGSRAAEKLLQPTVFSSVTPDSLAVRVKLGSSLQIIKALKDEDVQFVFETLLPDCDSLRSGEHKIHFYVDPERAASVLAKFKGNPAVLDAGWTEGYSTKAAVRFPAAKWLKERGQVDREKLATSIASSASAAFTAKSQSFSWDTTTGQLMLKLSAPKPKSIPGIDLADIICITILVGPESPISKLNLVAWLEELTIKTVDQAADHGFRLLFDEDKYLPDERKVAAFTDMLARDLDGSGWDFHGRGNLRRSPLQDVCHSSRG